MRCVLCGSTKVILIKGGDHKRVVAKSIVHRKGCPKCQNRMGPEGIRW